MSDGLGLFLTIVLEVFVFVLLNVYSFKKSAGSIKRRLWAGVLFLLLTPVIFFGTLGFVLIFDEGGWGAGILAVVFTGLYILNGIIILLSSVHIYLTK
ncbi:hypothetical protein LCM10_04950 [Rossellomorea aquimaris]|uniref:hypothetical protein n=1 Tax=Rossellomorea aquimaris TaxID=189382 RepID=UPI001CD3FA3E|nr:hypothetical protein [Rossellomorea aquimaris]MCA1054327.1 hypothetical protein [Rossellomorea aquimaris]